MNFLNKVVIVTGAGSGMGKAMVKEFFEEGAKVALIGRTKAKLDKVIESLGSSENLFSIELDVSNEIAVQTAIQQIEQTWGRIDVLINNAGVLDSYAPAHEVSLEEWNQTIAINLTGPFLMSKYAIPVMLKLKKGAILNVSSVSAISAAGGGSAYTASKHGLDGLTKQLCFEYGHQGIRVNSLLPGATATPMALPESKTEFDPDMDAAIAKVPARRWCQPEEIAKLASFMTSDKADYIHGSAFVIDGGWLAGARDAF
jgi:3-oxoacyl-[acyl-carrier protein] reductase